MTKIQCQKKQTKNRVCSISFIVCIYWNSIHAFKTFQRHKPCYGWQDKKTRQSLLLLNEQKLWVFLFSDNVSSCSNLLIFLWLLYFQGMVLLSGVVAFMVNLTIYWIIGNTSPVTYPFKLTFLEEKKNILIDGWDILKYHYITNWKVAWPFPSCFTCNSKNTVKSVGSFCILCVWPFHPWELEANGTPMLTTYPREGF